MLSPRNFEISVPIGVGEFIDRLSILEIKREHGLRVSNELMHYAETRRALVQIQGFVEFFDVLKAINLSLWNLEDVKRRGVTRYTDRYSDVSELITLLNDLRHSTKSRADEFFLSSIREVKSHDPK